MNLNKPIKEFFLNENAATMAEYALLLGLITVATAAVITILGEKICNSIDDASTALPS